MSFKIKFNKVIDLYNKFGVPMGYIWWGLWGSFLALVGSGILAYVLTPLVGIQYVSLSIVYYSIIIILLWLILTIVDLREGSLLNRISGLERVLQATREDMQDLDATLYNNMQIMEKHGL